jgi:hypothetical protein
MDGWTLRSCQRDSIRMTDQTVSKCNVM